VGDWSVNPASGEIFRNGQAARLDTRAMRLLMCLAEHPGEVVSIDALISEVWAGIAVAPDSVYQAVASLRRQLGDDPKQPTYIETVPRLGYRMVAAAGPFAEETATGKPRQGRKVQLGVAATAALCVVLITALLIHDSLANESVSAQANKSIAVLPFLDLTENMNQGPFADGMTEELIDKLSRIPGLRVPAPTASFYFRGKQLPVADIAQALGVAYILDGSVRKSGDRVRVATRLIRAGSVDIVWSETYDRRLDDILMVQDEIADQVTKALRASIEGPGAAR